MQEKFVEVAKIGSTYKLGGELKLYPLASSIETILTYKDWHIRLPYSHLWQSLKDESIIKRSNKLYIKLAGVDDVKAAERYVNALVGVVADSLPKLEEGQVYFKDIIGCSIINASGDCFGKVVDILQTGANEVLVCKTSSSEYLIPYVKQYIISEDISSKKIIVDWRYSY